MTYLLSPLDAANALGVHPRTLARLRAQGEIAYRRVGRQVRFSPVDLEEFVNSTRVNPHRTGPDVAA